MHIVRFTLHSTHIFFAFACLYEIVHCTWLYSGNTILDNTQFEMQILKFVSQIKVKHVSVKFDFIIFKLNWTYMCIQFHR